MIEVADRPLETVRIGFVGVGLQGSSHLESFLKIDGVEVRAVCDVVSSRAVRAQQMVVDAGRPRPEAYVRGPRDFERLCGRDDLDLVFNSTPWEWHVPVCVAAMEAGKHAATEVPAALTIEDCWRLVETSEATRRHCVMMENCSYGRVEMMVLNMVRQRRAGRARPRRVRLPPRPAGGQASTSTARARGGGPTRDPKRRPLPDPRPRPGRPVPRHQPRQPLRRAGVDGLEVPRSPALRRRALRRRRAPRPPSASCSSDVVTTLLETERGETVVVTHNTSSPRPYSRDFMIQGTRGARSQVPGAGRDPRRGRECAPRVGRRRRLDRRATTTRCGAGSRRRAAAPAHGGMDFIEDLRLIEAAARRPGAGQRRLRRRHPERGDRARGRSIAGGSAPMAFPDFTRGRWREPRQAPRDGCGSVRMSVTNWHARLRAQFATVSVDLRALRRGGAGARQPDRRAHGLQRRLGCCRWRSTAAPGSPARRGRSEAARPLGGLRRDRGRLGSTSFVPPAEHNGCPTSPVWPGR